MRFTRSYNPDVWHTLENLGIGRFAVQAGREREFANIYRGSDAARRLSDEEFAAVLAFTKAAFELALAFRSGRGAARRTQGRAPRQAAPRAEGAPRSQSASVRVTTSVTSGDRPGAPAIRCSAACMSPRRGSGKRFHRLNAPATVAASCGLVRVERQHLVRGERVAAAVAPRGSARNCAARTRRPATARGSDCAR